MSLHTISVDEALAALPAFPILRGRRVRLRAPGPVDADAVFALFADPDVTRYWSRPAMRDAGQAEVLLAEIDEAFAARSMLHWLIVERDAVLGSCALFRFDGSRRCAEIGYALRRERWGLGLARDAVGTMLEWGIRTLGLQRFEADVDPRNARSRRLLQALGFQSEGVRTGRFGLGDVTRAAEVFSLCSATWTARDNPSQPRAASAATAGSVLPSRNSRKAPPPVEM